MKNYKNQIIEGHMCVWLQSYGFAPAKKVKEFKVGQLMMWNWGLKSVIVEFGKETDKTIIVKTMSAEKGGSADVIETRMKKDKFVAMGSKEEYQIRKAYILGKTGFELGKIAPAQDSRVLAMLTGRNVGENPLGEAKTTEILAAWNKGRQEAFEKDALNSWEEKMKDFE